ncbi:MAG: RHS repeat-associated core domain-containing protein, partial [Phycisphaerales bacterium]|nr:RHS repeat-associated core domain-containing protein [Phycisphaerales bacterium]
LMLRETIESDLNSDGDLADQDEGTRVKTYTWGKDLGGGLESAGGIGGLLAVYDDSETSGSTGDDLAYVYMYDANGNVGQVCDLTQSTASASIVANYEYDAYGNATVSSGSYASANTYRFSTKPWDDETGLGYWGYRYYDPRLGRWMSRDPIGERGGVHLFSAVENNPITHVDRIGMCPRCSDATCAYMWTCWEGDPEREPLGVATCENGSPCVCVNSNRIQKRDEYKDASDLIGECVEEHEIVHCGRIGKCRPFPERNYDPSGECDAIRTEALCLIDAFARCEEPGRDKAKCQAAVNAKTLDVFARCNEQGCNPCRWILGTASPDEPDPVPERGGSKGTRP